MLAGSRYNVFKWHVISPGIVISLTAVARRVLSPDILIPVNGSEAMQKA